MRNVVGIRFAPVLFLCAVAWGQGSSSINGTVTDPSGAVIPNAVITVTEVETSVSRKAITNAEGLYVLTAVRPTSYSLTATAPGFRSVSQTGITVLVDQTVTINLALELGATTEVMRVEAAAVQVDTTTPTISQVVESQRIVELPLNGRNPAQLTTLVAGAVVGPSNSADQGVTKTFPVVVTASINGTRTNQTSFMLDGVPNIQILSNVNLPFPMPDALQEFSVQTSSYSAEYGQNAGGVVNIVTKSGSNTLHGNAFGFVRNKVFNARNFFASERDPLKRSQYGGDVGGPIKRDKIFFFFGYQGTNVRTETNGLSSFVPTPANLAGDFSSLLSATNPNNPQGRAISVKDPTNGQVYPGNLIPVERLDPASLFMAKNWLPATPGSGLVFYSRPTAQDFNEFTVRGDYNVSPRDRVGLRYFRDTFNQPGTLVNKNLLTYNDFSQINYTNAVLQETHIFSPAVLNEFRFGVARELDRRGPPTGAPAPKDFGVKGVEPTSMPSIEGINVSSYFNIGNFPPGSFPRVAFMWNDTVRWVRGRHSFSFGGSYERARLDELTETTKGATFSFTGDATGVAMADFMLGRIRSFTHGNGTIESNRHNLFSLFAQDTFKVSPRLTLNYGLRWEPSLPWHDRYQTGEIFFPDLYTAGVTSKVFPNAPPGELFPGDPGVPEDGRRGDWNVIAPRVGFAYDLSGNGKTSIRGGVGAFYDSRVPGWNTNRMSQGTPFTLAITLTSPVGPFSDPYVGVTNPFPAPLPPPRTIVFPRPVQVFSFDPSMQITTPVAYNGNITIERQLTANWLIRGAYVGARTLHANVNEERNPATYIPGSSLAPDARRPYQGYTSISVGGIPAGNAWYHSLQLTAQKRMAHGFTILANYTFSKTLDNLPINVDATNLGLGGKYVMPSYIPNYRTLDIGRSDFDRSHVVSMSYIWRLPGDGWHNALLRNVAGGWEINGILSVQSGGQLTVTAGQDRSQTAIAQDRAVLVPGQNVYSSGPCANVAPCVNFLNPQAFAIPALGTFGNVGKGSLYSPGLFNWDSGLGKSFKIQEKLIIQFRAEFFNVSNTMNLSTGTTMSVSGAGFGQVRSARDPRIGQLALKLTF